MKVLKFFFDINSPYSYIGFEKLLRAESHWPVSISLLPIRIPALFKAAENPSPAFSPRKALYMQLDLERVAKAERVPLRVPEGSLEDFVKFLTKANTVGACRLIIAVDKEAPEKTRTVTRALFSRMWTEHCNVFTDEELGKVLTRSGLPSSLLSRIGDDDVKKQLFANTDEAAASGSYGVPWMVVSEEDGSGSQVFFGSDRFGHISQAFGWKHCEA